MAARSRRGGARTVSDLGEFGLIRRIEAIARQVGGRDVVLGIGDDAALLRPRAGEDVVVTTDACVEAVHFRFDQETPRIAGRRAMVAGLSDLAAMGARPLGATLALGTPSRQLLAPLLALLRGLVAEGARYGCPLVGGNVTRSREVHLAITVLGGVSRGRALRRDRARPGDALLVTGRLGRSALERARGRVRSVPEARVEAGRALARMAGTGACLDISDGLLADLDHLCEASRVQADLWTERVPRARGLARPTPGIPDPEALVLAGGEDYELLFTMRGKSIDSTVLARRLGLPVSRIGQILARGAEPARRPRSLPKRPGWRHF